MGRVHEAAAAGDSQGDRDGGPRHACGALCVCLQEAGPLHCVASPWILDIKNSFFQLLNRQKPLPPIMAEYLDHREEKLAQIARVLFHKLPGRRSVAKELMIALGFGGGCGRARCCRTHPCLRMRGSAARWLLGSTASRRRRASGNYGVQLPGNYVVQQTRYLTAKDGQGL